MKPTVIVITAALVIVAVWNLDSDNTPMPSAVAKSEAPRVAPLPRGPIPLRLVSAAEVIAAKQRFALASLSEGDSEMPLDQKQAEQRWAKIEFWLACEKSNKCKFPESDSRAASIAVRDSIIDEVEWFLARKPVSEAQSAKCTEAAERLLGYPEEEVQAAALKWILALPSNGNTVSRLRENLGDMVDPELVRLSVIELKRHMGTNQEDAALDFVEDLLFHGGIFASREIARSAPFLMHEGNRARFERWVAQLPPSSAKTRLLQESLNALDSEAGI